MPHPRFAEILKELQILHDKKNSDYSIPDRPLSNLQECEDMGIPGWIGVAVRLGDKYSRLKQCARKHFLNEELAVKGETVRETLRDNAIYSILAMILYEEGDKVES